MLISEQERENVKDNPKRALAREIEGFVGAYRTAHERFLNNGFAGFHRDRVWSLSDAVIKNTKDWAKEYVHCQEMFERIDQYAKMTPEFSDSKELDKFVKDIDLDYIYEYADVVNVKKQMHYVRLEIFQNVPELLMKEYHGGDPKKDLTYWKNFVTQIFDQAILEGTLAVDKEVLISALKDNPELARDASIDEPECQELKQAFEEIEMFKNGQIKFDDLSDACFKYRKLRDSIVNAAEQKLYNHFAPDIAKNKDARGVLNKGLQDALNAKIQEVSQKITYRTRKVLGTSTKNVKAAIEEFEM